MMAEQMFRIIAGLLVGVWVARYLGPEQFGVFSYVLAFTAIFSGIAKLGLDGVLVRELVRHPEYCNVYLGTAFWLKMIGALITMSLIAAILPFTNNNAITNLYIFIIATGLIFQSYEVVEFYFQSQVLAKFISICKVIQLALSSAIKVYLVLANADLIYFVLVITFDAISLAVSYYIAYKFKGKIAFYNQFDLSVAKRLLKDSWPLIFSSLVVMIYMRIDQIMINGMMGDYEVGIYSAAVRVSEVLYFIPTLLAASLFPAILKAKNKNEMNYRLSKLYGLLLWMAIILAVLISVKCDLIISVLFGANYSLSADVLLVHVWAMPFVYLLVASGRWFIAEGYTLLALYRNCFALLANIISNYYLISKYGVVGAAWSTLIAFALSALIFDLFTVKTRQQFFLKIKSLLWI